MRLPEFQEARRLETLFWRQSRARCRPTTFRTSTGYYGPENSNISTLQERGAVFIACHDSIHTIARSVRQRAGGSGLSADAIAADLTNHLIPGAVLVPSVVAFLVELQRVGFTYTKSD